MEKMFALNEEKDYSQDRACYIQVQGHMEWVGFVFLLRIDRPQSLYYSFLRVNLTAKLDWLAPQKIST